MKSLQLLLFALSSLAAAAAAGDDRPNILWLTSEDNGPELGCYGDDFATTPNIDTLASTGTIFLNCWSTAPVCAPARTTLLGGIYPASAAAQHMRSAAPFPASLKTYPEHLRAAGYYCINPGKTDYNYIGLDKKVWDKNLPVRQLAAKAKSGTPFMAVYNYTISHESKLRTRPHKAIHDPAKVRVPPYHPDTPEVRQDWAQYYDKVTEMDTRVGAKLNEFRAAGLLENTIVFYYGDHGSGMPRSKRWPYNSGLRVPLVVSVPEKFKHLAPPDIAKAGGKTDRLVGFVDFAPTVLSIAGIKPPEAMHGHAFMGAHSTPPQPYIYGFRGRMDERYDCVRTVRDQRWHYIRNYAPHKIFGQYIAYMFQTPTTRVWHDLYHAGKLDAAQSAFWQTKAPEELYDLESDPDEIHNLAADPAHATTLTKLRSAQENHAFAIRDLGFLPEGEMHSRANGTSPYEMGKDDQLYPIRTIHAVAAKATSLKPEHVPDLIHALHHTDSAVRYWGANGILMRAKLDARSTPALHTALTDDSPHVRIAAAEALGRYGDASDTTLALATLMEETDITKVGFFRSVAALNAIDSMGDRAKPALDHIRSLPKTADGVPQRMSPYVPDLLKRINATLTR